jgi:hypothetical protein
MMHVIQPNFGFFTPLPPGFLDGISGWDYVLIFVVCFAIFMGFVFFRASTNKERDAELWEKNSKKDDEDSA